MMVHIAGKQELDEYRRADARVFFLRFSGLLSHFSRSFCFAKSFGQPSTSNLMSGQTIHGNPCLTSFKVIFDKLSYLHQI